MNEGKSYIKPVGIGEVMRAGTVGEIIESKNPAFAAGDFVVGSQGVQSYAISNGKDLTRIDAKLAPLPKYLNTLGMPGMTGYFGLLDVGLPKPGETIVVSAATGAVGQVVGQIEKIKGCKVVGIAGGPEKCQYAVETLGYDACIDHKSGSIAAGLAQHCPQGIDVYFDNVGGEHLEAALDVMNPGGRVALCGQISQYNAMDGSQRGPSNLFLATVKGLTLRGFLARMFASDLATFQDEVAAMLANGAVTSAETVRHGLDAAPQALVDLLGGGNVGKMLVCLD